MKQLLVKTSQGKAIVTGMKINSHRPSVLEHTELHWKTYNSNRSGRQERWHDDDYNDNVDDSCSGSEDDDEDEDDNDGGCSGWLWRWLQWSSLLSSSLSSWCLLLWSISNSTHTFCLLSSNFTAISESIMIDVSPDPTYKWQKTLLTVFKQQKVCYSINKQAT